MGGAYAPAAVAQLLDEIERLRRALRLYPPEHPAVEPFRSRLNRCLKQWESSISCSFGVRAGRLLVQGEEIQLGAETPAARLTDTLARLSIVGVRIDFPEGATSVEKLALLLAELGEPPQEVEGQRVLAAARALPGVVLTLLDASLLQLVEGEQLRSAPEQLMTELVQRLIADQWLALPAGGNLAEQGAATLAGVLEGTPHPETVASRLFTHLAEVVRSDPEQAPLRLGWVRELLDEMKALLAPHRWHLAIAIAATHLPPEVFLASETRIGLIETLLEAVEALLASGGEAPAAVVALVRQVANALGDPTSPLPPQVVVRAQVLLHRLQQAGQNPSPTPSPSSQPFPTHCPDTVWARELNLSLSDREIGLYLGRLLAEVMTVWPQEEVAEAAAHRLATEFVSAFETGDFSAAERFSSILSAQPFLDARREAAAAAVRIAQGILRHLDGQGAASVVAILAALGSEAVPHLLQALVESDHRATREQLVKAVLHHGPRAIPHVRTLLADSRWYAVRNGVFLLRRLEDRDSLPELRPLADHPAPQVRIEVFKALAALRDPLWLRILLRHVDDPDPERWSVALSAAARISDPEITAALIARLRQRWGLRLRETFTLEVIRTLAELRDPAALPVLRELTELRQWRFPFSVTPLRREAAVAIAQLPSAEARQTAYLLAHDHDREVAAAVRHVLRHTAPAEREGLP